MCPDAADAEERRGAERAIVDAPVVAREAAGDGAREHRGEDEREAPVDPRRRHGEGGDERDGAAGGARQARQAVDGAAHRARGGHDVAGDDDQRHLHGEGEKIGEARAPRGDQLSGGHADGQAGDEDDDGGGEREDEGVGQPALGQPRQRERDAREATFHDDVGITNRWRRSGARRSAR